MPGNYKCRKCWGTGKIEVECDRCHGKSVNDDDGTECSNCGGTGKVEAKCDKCTDGWVETNEGWSL